MVNFKYLSPKKCIRQRQFGSEKSSYTKNKCIIFFSESRDLDLAGIEHTSPVIWTRFFPQIYGLSRFLLFLKPLIFSESIFNGIDISCWMQDWNLRTQNRSFPL